jgi:hypothetical protein
MAGQDWRQFVDRRAQDDQGAVICRNLGTIIQRYRSP